MMNLRIDAQSSLTAIIEHDRFISEVERTVLQVAIDILDQARIRDNRNGNILDWCVENQCGRYPQQCTGVNKPGLCPMTGEPKETQSPFTNRVVPVEVDSHV